MKDGIIEGLKNNGEYLDNIPDTINEDSMKQYIGKYISLENFKKIFPKYNDTFGYEIYFTGFTYIIRIKSRENNNEFINEIYRKKGLL